MAYQIPNFASSHLTLGAPRYIVMKMVFARCAAPKGVGRTFLKRFRFGIRRID